MYVTQNDAVSGYDYIAELSILAAFMWQESRAEKLLVSEDAIRNLWGGTVLLQDIFGTLRHLYHACHILS